MTRRVLAISLPTMSRLRWNRSRPASPLTYEARASRCATAIPSGHKIALAPIGAGEVVIKYRKPDWPCHKPHHSGSTRAHA